MRNLVILVGVCIWGIIGVAQMVPKKVLVAHFTNTLCSVCATRNPGFLDNLNNQNMGDLIHIAYHPSRPYNTCIFNQHNVGGNDDYAIWNKVYGSTPRIVCNGDAISPSQNYTDPTLFDPYKGQNSALKIELKQQKFGSDSIRVNIKVITVAANNLASQNIYLGLAEKQIVYAAPNGEQTHHNVFRTALWGNVGTSHDLSPNAGDTISYTITVPVHIEWDINQVFAYGFVQEDGALAVHQAEAILPSQQDMVPSGIGIMSSDRVIIYPNPALNTIQISSDSSDESEYQIFDMRGKLMKQASFTNLVFVNVSDFHRGAYFVVVKTSKGTRYKRMLKL